MDEWIKAIVEPKIWNDTMSIRQRKSKKEKLNEENGRDGNKRHNSVQMRGSGGCLPSPLGRI